MKLTLVELEICLQLVLAMLRARGIESIETGKDDLYWSILSEEWLRMQEKPDPAVGSLGDDFQQLRRLLSRGSEASSLDLERLAGVLKLLSDRASS